MGEERVQQARLQTLKFDFEVLHMKEDERIDTFTTKLTTLVNKADSLGHTMKDEELVRKLLNAVPDRLVHNNRYSQSLFPVNEIDIDECLLAFIQSQYAALTVEHWLSLLLKAADVEAARGHIGSSKIRVEAFITLRVLVAKISYCSFNLMLLVRLEKFCMCRKQ
nr:zinc finger, CCHC-type [Tanacetum cinerariifolium]